MKGQGGTKLSKAHGKGIAGAKMRAVDFFKAPVYRIRLARVD